MPAGLHYLNYWEKFKLLLWKNFCVQWNNRRTLILAIITPTLFCSMLIVMRFMSAVTKVPVMRYDLIDLDEAWRNLIDEIKWRRTEMNKHYRNFTHNSFIPQLIIGYAPSLLVAMRNIMRKVAEDYLHGVEYVSHISCEQLIENMQRHHYLMGICFDEKTVNIHPSETMYLINNTYPNHLNYTILMPNELRLYNDSYIGANWRTDDLYDLTINSESRIGKLSDGGYLGYVREGFVPLQQAISMSYLRLLARDVILPNISLHRFPYVEHEYDALNEDIEINISLFILMGFVYPIAHFTKHIVSEKEHNQRTIMKILGISNWLHFCSWFVVGYLTMLLGSLLVLILLKIHWYDGYAICSKSSWSVLFMVIAVYCIVSMSYCIMMTSIFTDTTTAAIITIILWLVSYLPYELKMKASEFQDVELIIWLASNTVMGFAFENILKFERYESGLQWSNLLDTVALDEDYSLAVFVFIMFILSIIYIIMALYIEALNPGQYGIPRKWNFCLESRQHRDSDTGKRSVASVVRMTKVFEVEPAYKKLTVEIKNLTKKFGNKAVVKDVSMNLYENEITMIMGHNGAGKSILFAMLAGIIKPTQGTALFNGFDMKNDPDQARFNMGVCMYDGMLIDELTVIDQLIFYSRLRGKHTDEALKEAERYLIAMNLNAQRRNLTSSLTAGLRKHLAVCCALVGGSTIVLLDEPGTNMDFASRKSLWDMLTVEKRGRTILMTSQFVAEVENFADRVGVMSDGELKCYGTTFFLKEFYGHGYHLSFVKSKGCETDAITQVLEKYVSNPTPESDLGSTLSYQLEEKQSGDFLKMLDELEERAAELGIEGCSITDTGFEDIFLKMGAEDSGDGDRQRSFDILNGKSIYVEEYEKPAFLQPYVKNTGRKLFFNHYKAMMYKRLIYNFRNKFLALLQLILPAIIISLTFLMAPTVEPGDLPNMRFQMRAYRETVTVIDSRPKRNELIEAIEYEYREMLFWLGMDHKVENTHGKLFSNYIMEKQKCTPDEVLSKYLIGATFGQNDIIAWFNNYPLHVIPLSLNMMHNAMLRKLLDENAALSVSIDPLLSEIERCSSVMNSSINVGNFLAVNLTVGVGFIFSITIMFLVKERVSGFKFMQTLSGLRWWTYWLSTFTADMVRVTLISTVVVATATLYEREVFLHNWTAATYFAILMVAGVAIISYNYLLQTFFNDSVNAYCVITILNTIGGVSYCGIYDIFIKAYHEKFARVDSIEWPFLLFPHFMFCKALTKCFHIAQLYEICGDHNVYLMSAIIEKCQIAPSCCNEVFMWSIDKGIMTELLYLLGLTIISWILFFIVERRKFLGLRALFPKRDLNRESALQEHKLRHNMDPKFPISENVIKERVKVLSLKPAEYLKKPLVCDQVGKYYKDRAIVNRLFLLLERGECLGLLGHNGSGKSTILKLLVGQEELSFGTVTVDGIKLSKNSVNAYEHIGYCPQEGGILKEFTGSELMILFALLRGIPKTHVHQMCRNLSKMLGFYAHYHKRVCIYTTGIQKRLKCAIAMLSCPSIICIDESTSCLDPAGRRQLWNVFFKLCDKGKSIVIASLNPRDIQEFCSRVAFIARGNFVMIGTPTELKSNFLKAYFLTVKLHKTEQMEKRSKHARPSIKLQSFVETEFPNSQVHEQGCNIFVFKIPKDASTTLAKIFDSIENQMTSFNIVFFNITDATLTTVYNDFSETQRKLRRTELTDDELTRSDMYFSTLDEKGSK